MRDPAILPSTLHHLIVSGAKSFEMAVLPYRRQGGQQFYFAIMALQQHLGDASRAAEVTVDLERRMSAKEVGIGASGLTSVKMDGGLKEIPQEMIGMVAVVETCPETNLPCPRPACTLIATTTQGLAASVHQFGRFRWRQHRARIQAKEMRHMAV